MTMLAILCLPLFMLGFTALAVVVPAALGTISAPGPHGFTEALYAYVSGAGNNGSAFAGLGGNTLLEHHAGASTCLLGRFLVIIPALAIAGRWRRRRRCRPRPARSPRTGRCSWAWSVGVILIVGGLTFFPVARARPDRRALRDERRQRSTEAMSMDKMTHPPVVHAAIPSTSRRRTTLLDSGDPAGRRSAMRSASSTRACCGAIR